MRSVGVKEDDVFVEEPAEPVLAGGVEMPVGVI